VGLLKITILVKQSSLASQQITHCGVFKHVVDFLERMFENTTRDRSLSNHDLDKNFTVPPEFDVKNSSSVLFGLVVIDASATCRTFISDSLKV
jgi:hypothetical protein